MHNALTLNSNIFSNQNWKNPFESFHEVRLLYFAGLAFRLGISFKIYGTLLNFDVKYYFIAIFRAILLGSGAVTGHSLTFLREFGKSQFLSSNQKLLDFNKNSSSFQWILNSTTLLILCTMLNLRLGIQIYKILHCALPYWFVIELILCSTFSKVVQQYIPFTILAGISEWSENFDRVFYQSSSSG